mmetsp:Transcript_4352/g.5036  ORF Transcript_4352/g.5036 Transcript_4352/m.5036 type:complete len:493 (-) Transcript_4352:378-1856(-)|eukprot:CAMPEP_0197849078 /NCGR_PEP_ID=MMETSP1438-20131217/10818_1 /TAXON_ID=1461541 /ORGANISM="Pterosperma sp., Strain CCMP1384" /LENGTH=492 /DNA_ID=CAMNT_0043461601 /DNA_START=170 /DNA_END=1648 /DNA_ORIENTATION=-
MADLEKATALKEEGNTAFKAQNYQAAIAAYSRAINTAPDHATFYGNRSAAWFMIGQQSHQPKAFEECVRDCKKAIELDPQFVKAYTRGLKAMVHMGRLQEADEFAAKGLKAVPDNADIKAEEENLEEVKQALSEGEKLLNGGNFKGAKAAYMQVESKMEACATTKIGVARCELGLKNAPQALHLTLQVINADDCNSDAYWVRGDALYYTQNHAQAKRHYQESLRLNPDHSKCLASFKRLKAIDRTMESAKEATAKREFGEAVELYTEVMDLDPNNMPLLTTLYTERSNAYLRLKEYQLAIDDASAAIELDKRSSAPLITRSQAHTSLSQFEEAVKDLESALELEPENPVFKQRLQKAQVELRKSKRVDYYKVLGVTEHATAAEIKTAFKKKALEWHPDKHNQSEETKLKAEEVFKQIQEAHELLTDDRMRQLYDEGADKEMIDQQVQMDKQREEMFGGGGGCGMRGGSARGFRGGNPFGGGGNPFGPGGPFG